MTPTVRRKLEELAAVAGKENDGHGDRVAAMIPAIMAAVGAGAKDAAPLILGARLHDVGKRLVPPGILSAPRKLFQFERCILCNHSADGLELVRKVVGVVPQNIAVCIKSHHEHWDGSGYPDGLKGEEIPLNARIVSIGDVIDALASPRSYKAGLSKSLVCEVLDRSRGRFLDPALVEGVLKNQDAIFAARAQAEQPRVIPEVVPEAGRSIVSHLLR